MGWARLISRIIVRGETVAETETVTETETEAGYQWNNLHCILLLHSQRHANSFAFFSN